MELMWEVVGWAGAVAIVGAYLGVSMGWFKAGTRFLTATLTGACAFIVNGAFHGAWPSVITNVAWFLISAVALYRMRPTSPPPTDAVDDPQVQFPGIPDTTGQLVVWKDMASGNDRSQDTAEILIGPRNTRVRGVTIAACAPSQRVPPLAIHQICDVFLATNRAPVTDCPNSCWAVVAGAFACLYKGQPHAFSRVGRCTLRWKAEGFQPVTA